MTVEVAPTLALDRRFASRKWRLSLLALVLCVLARALNWVDGAQFVSLVEWVVGLYMAGNVGSAVAEKISIGAKSP